METPAVSKLTKEQLIEFGAACAYVSGSDWEFSALVKGMAISAGVNVTWEEALTRLMYLAARRAEMVPVMEAASSGRVWPRAKLEFAVLRGKIAINPIECAEPILAMACIDLVKERRGVWHGYKNRSPSEAPQEDGTQKRDPVDAETTVRGAGRLGVWSRQHPAPSGGRQLHPGAGAADH